MWLEVDVQYEGILVRPAKRAGKALPLVLVPHGGPHSFSTLRWSPVAALFSALGMATLYVRGWR